MTNLDILQLIRSLGDQIPPPGPDTDVVAYREALAARPRQSSKQAVDFVRDDHVSTGRDVIPVRYYRHGRSIDAQPTLIYFHGGGFVSGTLDTHDSICRRLARDTGWIIVSVDYRLAPEHPYPAAVDDGLAVVAWLSAGGAAARGLDIGAIALGGDSAGGAIAAVVASRACRTVALAHLLLVYPVLDTDFDTASYREYGAGYLLTTGAMRWFWDQYLGDSPAAESAVPARVDVSGLPPTTILAAGLDPLRDEAGRFADKLKEARIDVRYRCVADGFHGFLTMPDLDISEASFRFLAESLLGSE